MSVTPLKKEDFTVYTNNRLKGVEHKIDTDVQPFTPIQRESFVNAMANAVNGVQVVTTDGNAGQFGLTINTMSSVSADPPMVLVCINKDSPVREAIQKNGVFCINVLSIQQKKAAEIFSGHPKQGKPYDFTRMEWEQGVTGSPILEKSLASFDCFVETSVDAGSHTIFVGSVVSTVSRDGAPLLYTNRSYGLPYLVNY